MNIHPDVDWARSGLSYKAHAYSTRQVCGLVLDTWSANLGGSNTGWVEQIDVGSTLGMYNKHWELLNALWSFRLYDMQG